ncbi:endolytic transglycosylase MltG [Glaciihabitans sp. dw_435]|uniref:endolytic transglycosylase MltG n=1 Tax=Glaciihabitans sp. dw_435 TaxID=2720081 RepID=UPI001BD1D7E1|nr:endolytic transglycosylase MltG [Glaciihabitans sp. dw_435]
MADEPTWEDLFGEATRPAPRETQRPVAPKPTDDGVWPLRQPPAPASALTPPADDPITPAATAATTPAASPPPTGHASAAPVDAVPAASTQPAAPVPADLPTSAAPVTDASPIPATPVVAAQPTRRQLRESEARLTAAETGRIPKQAARQEPVRDVAAPKNAKPTRSAKPPKPPRTSKRDRGDVKRRRRRGWIWLVVLLVVFGAAGGTAAYAWANFEGPIRKVLNIELPIDYTGTGNGQDTTVTVVSGDVGETIAESLHAAGVTMTKEAFYNLLLAKSEQPVFQPGTYKLQKHQSAASALTALLDPKNLVVSNVLIPEGTTITNTLKRLSKGTGVPLADFTAAAKDYVSLGVPANAPSAEGFLFPATYTFEPGSTAKQILTRMVDRMYESLDAAGVAPKDRLRVLTMAALIQKEGGSTKDFYKVARVFQNRLDQKMLLQSDATVSYGSGGTSISTTDAERADASNPYNTYVHLGLPVGPISAPGDDAIDAALHPVAGDWLYFVLVNGDTGETKFSTTLAQHEAAVAQWQSWLAAHPDFDN